MDPVAQPAETHLVVWRWVQLVGVRGSSIHTRVGRGKELHREEEGFVTSVPPLPHKYCYIMQHFKIVLLRILVLET